MLVAVCETGRSDALRSKPAGASVTATESDGGTAVTGERPGRVSSGNCTGSCGSGTCGPGTVGTGITGTGMPGTGTAGIGSVGIGSDGSGTDGTWTPGTIGASESTAVRTESTVSLTVPTVPVTALPSGGAARLTTVPTASAAWPTTGSTTLTTVAAVPETGDGTAAIGAGTSLTGGASVLPVFWKRETVACSIAPSGFGSLEAAFAEPAAHASQATVSRAASKNGRRAVRQQSRKVPPIQITPQWQWKIRIRPAVSAVQTCSLATQERPGTGARGPWPRSIVSRIRPP